MSIFDTHCHLTSKRIIKQLDTVLQQAKAVGVDKILSLGTNVKSSVKSLEIANQYDNVYAAVGIHPSEIVGLNKREIDKMVAQIKVLLNTNISNANLVAIGEIGLDRNYCQNKQDLQNQKYLFGEQIKLAKQYNKAISIHNREMSDVLLSYLQKIWTASLQHKVVFHCAEPNDRILTFAIQHNIFLGVDGDITYNEKKQQFIKKVPIQSLVVETDSPYLLPEPLFTQKKYPNLPQNIIYTLEIISKIKNINKKDLTKQLYINSQKLFLQK